jgi:branched-chain amino acid transport system permease protein
MTEILQIVLSGAQVGCIYALIALGFSLVYRVTNVINLSQGAFCLIGALFTYSLEVEFGWALPAAAAVAAVATTALGALAGALTFVPGLPRLSNANMLMLTAGLLTLFEGLMLVTWGSQPYALPPFSGQEPVAVAALLIPTQQFWIVGTTILIIFVLWYLLQKTTFGQALRACAENPGAATLMGISVSRMQLVSFTLAALIGAIAGIVSAPATSLQFDTGRLFTIQGFIAVAIGGIASFPGAIAGGLLLGIVTQLATAYISSLFSNAIALALLLVVLLWRPSGLIRAGAVRRQDVRDEPRVWKHITRLRPTVKWTAGAVGAVIALALPLAVPSGGIMSGLVIAAILFIALMGLDVVMGYAGQVNLGQAGFMAIGGYTAGYLAIQYNAPPIIGLLAGLVLSVAAALGLSLITMRLRGLYLALATLAFGLLIDSCAVGLADITGGPSGMVGIPSFSVGPLDFSDPVAMYYLVIAIDIVLLFLLGGLMRSALGRALQAIRTDQMAAAALGINVVGCKLIAFCISAALASVAGSLYAFFFHFLSPEMVGTPRSLELVAMLVIGGEGTLVGGLFGAALLTLLPTIFQPLAQWKTFASGALLVLSFLYLPEGIWGSFARWLASRFTRRGQPPLSPRLVPSR